MDRTQNTNPSSRFSTHRLLSGMKIRKKLIVLHTAFSLGLGTILLLAIYPAMSKVIRRAEVDQSKMVLELLITHSFNLDELEQVNNAWRLSSGSDALRNIPTEVQYQARLTPEQPAEVTPDSYASGVICYFPARDEFVVVRSRAERVRTTVQSVYILIIATLLLGYGLVAAALELFVLPQHVYSPIRSMLFADIAVAEGNRDHELIPDQDIPADELGEIMRTRNDAILALRKHEHDLAQALDRLEQTATDLHKKNHLLETARKNLQGADRLASLGMMSAGIAHELNTPLAVVKGLVEKLNRDSELSDTEVALLVRVVKRLETLSEGLLDFARVRPPMSKPANLLELVSEAQMLVMIDRKDVVGDLNIEIFSDMEEIEIQCDPDRIVQVFVNLIRNAIDALVESRTLSPEISIRFDQQIRDDEPWVTVTIIDNGPGIDSDLIERLFEPFVSTRLDAHGTGLGLAVANGIVREHGGVLTARNRTGEDQISGAAFEVFLPYRGAGSDSV